MWAYRTAVFIDLTKNQHYKTKMRSLKKYQSPALDVAYTAVERGFCVSLEFGVGVQGIATPESFEMEDMTESTDNAAW